MDFGNAVVIPRRLKKVSDRVDEEGYGMFEQQPLLKEEAEVLVEERQLEGLIVDFLEHPNSRHTGASGRFRLGARCWGVDRTETTLHSLAQPFQILVCHDQTNGETTSVSRGSDSRLPSPTLPLPDPVLEGSFAIRNGSTARFATPYFFAQAVDRYDGERMAAV